MRLFRSIITVALALWALAGTLALHGQASASQVPSPEKRQKVIDEAKQLLVTRDNPATNLPADLPCPFLLVSPAAPDSGPAASTVHRLGNHEVLQKIATQIQPSGAAIWGGEAILIFNQKKVKVGDHLKITFEGVDYLLEVGGITSTSFTLRLNNEEVTRPIK